MDLIGKFVVRNDRSGIMFVTKVEPADYLNPGKIWVRGIIQTYRIYEAGWDSSYVRSCCEVLTLEQVLERASEIPGAVELLDYLT